MLNITISYEAISRCCEANRIEKLSLFGSVLRQDFNSESDIDVLIEFEPHARVTFLNLARMQTELSQLFQRHVDLLTPGALSDYFRDDVLKSAQVIYAK